MKTQSTRISKYVIEEVGKIAEEIGSPTDDTAMRHVIAEYKRLKLENDILRRDNDLLKMYTDDIDNCIAGDTPQTEKLIQLKYKWGIEAIAEDLEMQSYNE